MKYKRQGWHNESYKHSLAAKGIRTSFGRPPLKPHWRYPRGILTLEERRKKKVEQKDLKDETVIERSNRLVRERRSWLKQNNPEAYEILREKDRLKYEELKKDPEKYEHYLKINRTKNLKQIEKNIGPELTDVAIDVIENPEDAENLLSELPKKKKEKNE